MFIATYTEDFESSLNSIHVECFQEIGESVVKTEGRSIFLAFNEDKAPIGYVVGGLHEGKLYVEWLGVLPKYRGKALGRYLLETIIDQFKDNPECKEVTVCTRERFHFAMCLYQSMAFKETRRFINEKDGEEMIVYNLELRK